MLSGVSGQTVAGVAVDAVHAGGAIAAGIAETFVDVVLAVAARRPRLAAALVAADQVLAVAPELARIRLAFVDLRLQNNCEINHQFCNYFAIILQLFCNYFAMIK